MLPWWKQSVWFLFFFFIPLITNVQFHKFPKIQLTRFANLQDSLVLYDYRKGNKFNTKRTVHVKQPSETKYSELPTGGRRSSFSRKRRGSCTRYPLTPLRRARASLGSSTARRGRLWNDSMIGTCWVTVNTVKKIWINFFKLVSNLFNTEN